MLTSERCADRVVFFVASPVQTQKSAQPGHEIGHFHLGRLRRLRIVVEGRHSPGSHLLRQDLTVAPPQLLLYLTSSAGSRIQSLIWMSSMLIGPEQLQLTSRGRKSPVTHSNGHRLQCARRPIDERFDRGYCISERVKPQTANVCESFSETRERNVN